MQNFIDTISSEVIYLDKLNNQVVEITQLIKTTQTNKKKESNICEKDLFFRLVKEVSLLIDVEQSEQGMQQSISLASFIFKDEFKSIIMALFVLFEYNLKFIFTDSKELPMGKLPKSTDKPQTLRQSSGPGIAYWILAQ